jgi:hypothetical protein
MDGSTAASVWNEVAETNEVIAQAATTFNSDAVETTSEQGDLDRAREALLVLTSASKKLARLLDALASHYDAPDMPEPPKVHVALDQAAAAADDLGTCAKAAARAIDDAG